MTYFKVVSFFEQFVDFFVFGFFLYFRGGVEDKKEGCVIGVVSWGGMIRIVDIDLFVYYDVFQVYGRKVCCLNKIEILR